jgi:hypothetical protein
MAEGATIGALRFILGADTAQLEAATGRASKSLRQAAAAGEAAGAAIVGALSGVGAIIASAFAVERVIAFAAESLKAAAAIAKFADQAGLTTREFQGLEFALRDAQVPQEQLAQGFAIFSRNLSDLQRNTGPFLDFLRRYAPEQIAAFRASANTAEAFRALVDFVNQLGNSYDRVRVLTAAGAEQFGRLNNVIRQGSGPIAEQARAFQGLSEEAIKRAQEIERRWDDMVRRLRLAFQEAIVGAGDPDPGQRFEQITARIAELEVQLADRSTNAMRRRFEKQAEYNELLREQIRLLGEAYAHADRQAQLPPPTTPPPNRGGVLGPDQIKAAQDQLALFMARLNQLPSQANFVSGAFQEAWRRMDAAMAATGASEAARAAARIGLIQQEAAARTSALGNAMLVQEQFALREEELRLRRNQGIISETEYQRALNIAKNEYNMAQLTELQGLGVTLSIQEQYQLSIDRTSNALARGAMTAEQAGRAHRAAALTAQAAWLGALGQVAGALAQAFPKQKAFAVAAAIINVAEGITKALTLPFPLNWIQAAAVAASGLAQINAIKSANPAGSGGSVPAVGGGASAGTTAPVEATGASMGQSLTINLPAGRYSHEEVMQIIEGINDRVQNGATLISTKVAA